MDQILEQLGRAYCQLLTLIGANNHAKELDCGCSGRAETSWFGDLLTNCAKSYHSAGKDFVEITFTAILIIVVAKIFVNNLRDQRDDE